MENKDLDESSDCGGTKIYSPSPEYPTACRGEVSLSILLGVSILPTNDSPYTITHETFDTLYSIWQDPKKSLRWFCPFVLPAWLEVWWTAFGHGAKPYICSVWQEDELLGVAPLLKKQDCVSFIGDVEVCDYQDFIITPGKEEAFFRILVDHLKQEGIKQIDLAHLRPDSSVLAYLAPEVEKLGCGASSEQEEVSSEMDLPATWEDFLLMLSGKERHEVRRKLRRLRESGRIDYRMVKEMGDVGDGMDTFMSLFESNKSDKAAFMDPAMTSFFRALADAMAKMGILNLFFLDLDNQPTAAVMCFDFNGITYLYNSGYDDRYRSLSVGLLCKVLNIKDSIERGKKKYDFLKGDERYKSKLGGKNIPLYRYRVNL